MIGRPFFFCWRGAADSHSGRVPATVLGLWTLQRSAFQNFGESEEVEGPISFLARIPYYCTPLIVTATRTIRRRTQISSAQRDQGLF